VFVIRITVPVLELGSI